MKQGKNQTVGLTLQLLAFKAMMGKRSKRGSVIIIIIIITSWCLQNILALK